MARVQRHGVQSHTGLPNQNPSIPFLEKDALFPKAIVKVNGSSLNTWTWPPNELHCLGMKVSLFKEHKFGHKFGKGVIQWAEKWHRVLWDLARKCLVELTYWVIGSLWRGFLGRAWLHSSSPLGLPSGGWGGDWLSPPGLCKDLLLEALLSSFSLSHFLNFRDCLAEPSCRKRL